MSGSAVAPASHAEAGVGPGLSECISSSELLFAAVQRCNALGILRTNHAHAHDKLVLHQKACTLSQKP